MIYRDATDGAQARRDDLLARRRQEAAMLPLEVRRIYVRRVSRAVTGAVAAASGVLLLLGIIKPAVEAWIAAQLPGQRPAPLSTLLLGAAIVTTITYFIARSWAEDRFTRRMRRAVLATEDLYGDLDRLGALRPLAIARDLAVRAERASVALPLIGAALLGPALGLVASRWLGDGYLPLPEQIDAALRELVRVAWPACLALTWGAVLLTNRLAAAPTARLARAAWVAHPVTGAVIGGILVIAARGLAIGGGPTLAWLGGALALGTLAGHLTVLRIRHERTWLERDAGQIR